MNTTTHEYCETPQPGQLETERELDLEAMSRDEAEHHFQTWVNSVRWQFAKTYAKKAPHEYTVITWRPELEVTFRKVGAFIRKHGQIDLYHGHPFTVYYLNGWKYWDMDGLINRTCADWCVAFKLTWNPPATFQPMPLAQCEACQKILLAYAAICQTPAARVSPAINEKE